VGKEGRVVGVELREAALELGRRGMQTMLQNRECAPSPISRHRNKFHDSPSEPDCLLS
jgi:hypothetical protein